MTGLWIALLLAGPLPAAAPEHRLEPLKVVESEERVLVRAADLRTLRRLLADPTALDGHPASGLTRSSLEVRSTVSPTPMGCALTALEMRVHITRVLPSLQAPKGGRGPRPAQWREAVHRLEQHEDGHRQHALAAAHGLHARLKALPVGPTCATLQQTIRRLVRLARARLELRDHYYDQRTRHGTQRSPRDGDRPLRPPPPTLLPRP